MTLTTITLKILTLAAIAATDATEHEARLLWRIGELESGGFRVDVATCAIKGDRGRAHGLWQIHPRTAAEVRDACTLEGGARIALDRVRESLRVCAHLPERRRLAAYVSGSCERGWWEAERRWVE